MSLKKKNKQFNNNKILNHHTVLHANKIFGYNMIKVTFVKIVKILSTNKKIQIDEKILTQDNYFSNKLPYADKKIREILMNMVNTTFNSTEDMINKFQNLRGKTMLKFQKNPSNFYDEKHIRNFKFKKTLFVKMLLKVLAKFIMKFYC